MYEWLGRIQRANDIKEIPSEDYRSLAGEIRKYLLSNVSHTGGHLASNLGVVELTMAIHLCLDFPEDKLVWDVGHQTYTHKMLTGRKEQLGTLRRTGGISGFPKVRENACDSFDTGHSSTSLSAALGFARARDIKGEAHKVFAVIGDGALSGGMAYEALNNAAAMESNMVIVLNDNKMSISENVGGMANYLGKIRTADGYRNLKGGVENTLLKMPGGDALVDKIRRSKDSVKRLVIPGMWFEDIGVTYIGPIDGHDVQGMVKAFRSAMKMDEAVVVHVKTKKGKGYRLAEKDPSTFHGIAPFNLRTGEPNKTSETETYTKVFSDALVHLGRRDESVVAVCAGMPGGTGTAEFAKEFPERFFDVGIAEGHAVTFAAGLAAGGLKPVVAIYSTFLQRAYDQILHDVCLGGHPVVFAVDRGGVVGKDGETHQGVYDISFLSSIPGMTVVAPKNKWEFVEMLRFCIGLGKPVAVRYPNGPAYEGLQDYLEPIRYAEAEVVHEGSGVLLLCTGSMVGTGEEVRRKLAREGHAATLVNMRFIHPFDEKALERLIPSHDVVVTMEENVRSGGFGQQIALHMQENGWADKKFLPIALPDQYIEQGNKNAIKEKYGLGADAVYKACLRTMEGGAPLQACGVEDEEGTFGRIVGK